MGSTFIINGQRIEMSGRGSDIIVGDGNIFINGVKTDLTQFGDAKVFNIVIEGNVDSVTNVSGMVEIHGNAGEVKTTSGKIIVDGEVSGSVKTVSGDVTANGSIGGSVKTVSGDIRSK